MKTLINQVLYSWHLIFHPFDGFWDLKHEKRGSVKAANTIILLLILTMIIQKLYTGLLFSTYNPLYINVFGEVFNIFLPFVLWCVSNWCLTTLMDGEGSFKDIYIASAYALVPLIIVGIPLTVLSNYLTLETAAFYTLINSITMVWAGGLMVAGLLVTHQYTLGKTIITSIMIVVGIGVIIFLSLLFFSLIQQVLGFVLKLAEEIILRK